MMGRQDDGQGQFLYHFDLDEMIPEDHLLRLASTDSSIRRLASSARIVLQPYGPSSESTLNCMIRMLLIGYCYGIRSERRLCEEVKLNLAYRWFCRLSIEDRVAEPLDIFQEP